MFISYLGSTTHNQIINNLTDYLSSALFLNKKIMFKTPAATGHFYFSWLPTADQLSPAYSYFNFANTFDGNQQCINRLYGNAIKKKLWRMQREQTNSRSLKKLMNLTYSFGSIIMTFNTKILLPQPLYLSYLLSAIYYSRSGDRIGN
jgi:hypothetical protein